MQRASYKAAIAWIAQNDSAADHDALDAIAAGSLVSSILVADLFGVDSDKVGNDIVKYRKKHMADQYDEEDEPGAPVYMAGDQQPLPAALWCEAKHTNGHACNDCGPTIESHLIHKAAHGT